MATKGDTVSALDDAIIKAIDQAPLVELAAGDDWIQIDPISNRFRWRQHREAAWGGWTKCWRSDLDEIHATADQSTVRLVPRAEADDWRRRPGFPCHERTT